jgi:hypothetical protein
MSSKELDNLVRFGALKREAGSQQEFDGLLESGRKRLADSKIDNLSLDGKFSLAYDAAHAFSLAALRWHGYRSDKRYVVFQALPHTLGLKPEIWRVLDKAHQQRNIAEYEGSFRVDGRLFADLIQATEVVHAAVGKLGPIAKE